MEWRGVPGYEEDYEVSNTGEVRSLNFNQQKGMVWTLRPQENTSGYYQVNLKKKLFCVHRLVALAFLPNPHGLPEVDHIDRNKANNKVSNLRWVTLSQNRINVPGRSKCGYKYISNHCNGYMVRIIHNRKVIVSKWTKTLEEAIQLRDSILSPTYTPQGTGSDRGEHRECESSEQPRSNDAQ